SLDPIHGFPTFSLFLSRTQRPFSADFSRRQVLGLNGAWSWSASERSQLASCASCITWMVGRRPSKRRTSPAATAHTVRFGRKRRSHSKAVRTRRRLLWATLRQTGRWCQRLSTRSFWAAAWRYSSPWDSPQRGASWRWKAPFLDRRQAVTIAKQRSGGGSAL